MNTTLSGKINISFGGQIMNVYPAGLFKVGIRNGRGFTSYVLDMDSSGVVRFSSDPGDADHLTYTDGIKMMDHLGENYQGIPFINQIQGSENW